MSTVSPNIDDECPESMVMSVKKFYLKGNGKVFDVYLRPSLIALGVGYDLKIACRNLRKENKVEVLVSGRDEAIQQFWDHVKEHDIRPVKDEKAYLVSDIETYKGVQPDWTYHMSASTMEQISKGVTSLEGIDKTLHEIDEKFGGLEKRFGMFGSYAERIDQKLVDLPERIAEALSEGRTEKPKRKAK